MTKKTAPALPALFFCARKPLSQVRCDKIATEINFEENYYLVQAFKMLQKNDYYFRSFGLRLFLIDILGIFLSFLIASIAFPPVKRNLQGC